MERTYPQRLQRIGPPHPGRPPAISGGGLTAWEIRRDQLKVLYALIESTLKRDLVGRDHGNRSPGLGVERAPNGGQDQSAQTQAGRRVTGSHPQQPSHLLGTQLRGPV
jgi:hypothetical protein